MTDPSSAFARGEAIGHFFGGVEMMGLTAVTGVRSLALLRSAGTESATPLISARSVRYTHNSVGQYFKDGRSVLGLAEELTSGIPKSLPPIRLFVRDGKTYSLDNRRLLAGQIADSRLPFRWATNAEIAKEAWKFTTTTDGTSILLRRVGEYSFWSRP